MTRSGRSRCADWARLELLCCVLAPRAPSHRPGAPPLAPLSLAGLAFPTREATFHVVVTEFHGQSALL